MNPFGIQNRPLFISLMLSLGLCACSKQNEESKDRAIETPPVQSVAKDTVAVKESDDKPKDYESYCNSRYNYCIDYPTIMVAQPEAGNGDGRVFINPKDSATLTVYGTIGIDLETEAPIPLKERYVKDMQNIKDQSPDNRITYQQFGQRQHFFVISGYKKDRIFYQKTIVKLDENSQNPSFAYAILEYRDQDKEVYNKISEKVFTSFE
jgi:hypothetical protein